MIGVSERVVASGGHMWNIFKRKAQSDPPLGSRSDSTKPNSKAQTQAGLNSATRDHNVCKSKI